MLLLFDIALAIPASPAFELLFNPPTAFETTGGVALTHTGCPVSGWSYNDSAIDSVDCGGSASQQLIVPWSTDYDFSSTFFLSAWIRSEAGDCDANRCSLVHHRTGVDTGFYLGLQDGHHLFLEHPGGTLGGSGAATLVPTTTWTWVAVAGGPNGATLYVDGQPVVTDTNVTGVAAAVGTDFRVGFHPLHTSHAFTGRIDDVVFQASTLSDSQVLDLYRWYTDLDGDGYARDEDCDDQDDAVYPNRSDPCDGVDNDCDGQTDEDAPAFAYYTDEDDDGFGTGDPAEQRCGAPSDPSLVGQAGDCDDTDANVNPDANEVCNGIDDDCDGQADEGFVLSTFYYDDDDDGFGGEVSVDACPGQPPTGTTAASGDCDDGSPTVFPGAIESCDGVDQDCDGTVDEGLPGIPQYADVDGDGFGGEPMDAACSLQPGNIAIGGDCDDSEPTVNPAAPEVCNQIDDDCNGGIDDGLPSFEYYQDQDGDGFGDPDAILTTCFTNPPSGYVESPLDCDDTNSDFNPNADELCGPSDRDCDGSGEDGAVDATAWYPDDDQDGFGAIVAPTIACSPIEGFVDNGTDCDDTTGEANPAEPEVCDGRDNDCDGGIDNDPIDPTQFFRDEDGDGLGVADDSVAACSRPAGYAAEFGDCGPQDPNVFEGALEQCDGIDNDCDGSVDEDIQFQDFYLDSDGDGYGDAVDPVSACSPPADHVLQSGDCNDADPDINPNAVDVCNGIDDNCVDGDDDAIDRVSMYTDADGDGYGEGVPEAGCPGTPGLTQLAGDCDDTDELVNPGMTEACQDGIDNNCNGVVDADAPAVVEWYLDVDGDGWGVGTPVYDCASPGPGYSNVVPGDCDDSNALRYPDAVEVCDGIDNDCDGLDDAHDPDLLGEQRSWYADGDSDGYGDADDAVLSCQPPAGYVADAQDCDDTDGTIHPFADELCDTIDQNCDGDLGGTREGYVDLDGDGAGDVDGALQCGGDELVPLANDCDDGDPRIRPDADEICGNGVDEDCDGLDAPCDGSTSNRPAELGLACATGPSGSTAGVVLMLAVLARRRI